jgi:dTDP-4-dehydrorhamnose reductase
MLNHIKEVENNMWWKKFNNKKKIAILGNGQLGSELFENLNNIYYTKIFSYPEFNICNNNQLLDIVKNYDIIINCVANINADKIENEQKDDSFNVNYLAVKNLAIMCKQYNKNLIHISSDYVYGSNNYEELLSEEYICNPINQYGIDKLAGENAILNEKLNNYLILRASWLFGKNGKTNFMEKIKNNLTNNTEIKVVNDQIGNITSTKLAIDVIKEYINNNIPCGIYNIQNNDEYVSRYEIANFIKEYLNLNCNIIACKTDEFVLPAKRQLNSKLNTEKIRKYVNIKPWKEVIINYLEETK